MFLKILHKTVTKKTLKPQIFHRGLWGFGKKKEPQTRTITRFTPEPRENTKFKKTLPPSYPPLTKNFSPIAEVEVDRQNEVKTNQTLPPKTTISKLDNGLKISSFSAWSSCSCVGVFVRCGSRDEPIDKPGLSKLLERLAFKSTDSRSTADMVLQLETYGAHISTSSSREVMIYSSELLHDYVPMAVELISDTIQNPQFTEAEIAETIESLSIEYEDQQTQPEVFLPEYLHHVAYPTSSFGNPLLPEPHLLQNITRNDLIKFMNSRYDARNMVLAGTGIEHSTLHSLGSKHLSSIPNRNPNPVVVDAPIYVGGELKIPSKTIKEMGPRPEGEPPVKDFIVLGFETTGYRHADFFSFAVLHTLLGGGNSFSAGGPGKGMYSRLYAKLLNRHDWLDSAEAFYYSYMDTGLFGVSASSLQSLEQIDQVCSVVCQELCNVAKKISDIELIRARNQLKSSIFMNLETRSIIFDDVGRQVLLYEMRYEADEICNAIDAVTIDDLKRVVRDMLQKVPSLVVYAPRDVLDQFPKFDVVTSFLNSVGQTGK